MYKRILHPTDFLSASRGAFTAALKTARASGARLVIAHVVTPPMPIVSDAYVPPTTYAEVWRAARGAAERQVGRLVARAKRAGVRAPGVVLEGVPHERIVRAARAMRADLIVIGTHGRTGLARLVLGSVAARVVAAAACPVLSVRGAR